MARKNPVRDAILADVKARRRAAGQKVQRLRNRGVNTADIDPRRSNDTLNGLSTRQLRAHLKSLNAFTARKNSYVPGLKGAPLSGAAWRQYQKAEKAYNAKSDAFYESVKDITIPTLNQTVGKYLANLRNGTDDVKARREGDYRTFGSLTRSTAGITSEASLQKLLKQMQRRADAGYLENEAKLQRRILNKMLARTSNKQMIPLVQGMSDEEVITLTQYTDFMDRLEGSYAMAKSISTDTPRWQSSVYEDNEEAIDALSQWASRHFSDKDESEQDTDDSDARKGPTRDRYGRFVRKDAANPEPKFARDEHGRFAPRT